MSCRILFFALFGVLLAAEAGGKEDPLAPLKKNGEVITARWRSGGLPLDPTSGEWRGVEPVKVALFPQASVRPKSAAREPMALGVRALYNERELALHLEWSDGHLAATHDIGRFPDAVAVQWPVRYGRGIRLPYVGMGHAGHTVALWFWRADGRVETLAAEGFGSLTPQPSDGVETRSAWTESGWRVVLKRSLKAPTGPFSVQVDPASGGLVPLALAVWNGEVGQRDGDKFLSAWHFLHFQKGKVDPQYARSLRWSPRIRGNPEVGKALMMKRGCMACHSFPGNPILTEVGPGLTWIGGILRPDFLLESIKTPSAVIVPGKTFSTVTKGKRLSVMPAIKIPERELFHMVEYLRTLR